MTQSVLLDYYLVLVGSRSAAASSHGGLRPWCIASVHLFDARQLAEEQRSRGVSIGTASSVRAARWDAAEIFPRSTNPALPVTRHDGQERLLRECGSLTEDALTGDRHKGSGMKASRWPSSRRRVRSSAPAGAHW